MSGQPFERLRACDARILLAPFARHRFDGCGRASILFHERHLRGTPRQGFEAECSAAGEQVEYARLFDTWLQPVEQGFPHTIGRRPNIDAGGELQSPPAMPVGDDAQDA